MKKILILIIFMFLLIACTPDAFSDNFSEFKNKKHVFKVITYEEVIKAFDSTAIVVFGFFPSKYDCPYCRYAFPIINEIALGLNYKRNSILFYDVYDIRFNNSIEYKDLIDLIAPKMNEDNGGYLCTTNDNYIIRVPDLFVIKQGVILYHFLATVLNENGNPVALNPTIEYENKLREVYAFMLGLL